MGGRPWPGTPLGDIRVAGVIEQDLAVDATGKITYRIKREVSFKMRPVKSQ
ncbi:hypothetical protein [Mycobacterium camsae]|uniref:hypothetical protein n=1 Tax=Mycobacterium gordonae TaxID=1778 RepID=UPI003D66311E